MGRRKTKDNSQVFDVSKPGRSAPSHTARPVIVDHRQVANDPMVTGATDSSTQLMTHAGRPVVPVQVSSDHSDHTQTPAPDAPAAQMDNFFGNTPEAAAGEQSAYKPEQSAEPETPPDQSFSSFQNHSDQPAPPPEQAHENQPNDMQSPSDSPPLPAELTAPGADDPVGLSNADSPGAMFSPAFGLTSESQLPAGGSSPIQNEGGQPGTASAVADGSKNNEQLPPVPENIGKIEHLPPPVHSTHGHFADEPQKRRWFLPALLLVLAGGYLILDSGIVGSGNMPFQIFKEKEEVVAENTPPLTQAPAVQAPPQTNAQAPSGFTQYSLPNSPLSFTYPTAWGIPSATADPGFTKRGAGNKSDGVYAHLISFADNKGVQLALTSSKYLPAKRSPQYFDFLQWCSGTHDGKFYRQQLLFSTTSGVDTPSTITCNDGPLGDGEKIDELTIVQKNTKDSTNKPAGDIYTKNLADKEFVVLRVIDATMANADAIKQLLAGVKTAP